MKRNSPPALAEWILLRITHVDDRSSILNDFHEIYKNKKQGQGRRQAAGWYWAQVIKSIPMFSKAQIYWSVCMLKSNLKTTLRILRRHKVFSLINIFGLAIGMALFLLLFQYISFEKSYDRFHDNADHIYRVQNDRIYSDINDRSAGCPPAVGPALKNEFPEVLESARIYNIHWTNTVVSSLAGYSEDNTDNIIKTFIQDKVFFAETSFLRMFSFPMIQGSLESALAEPNTVILSQSTAQKYFGAEDPMGKFLSISNSYFGDIVFEITGILKDVPSNSHIKFELLLSYPTLIAHDERAASYWGWNAFNTFVLLSPTADPQALEAKFPQIVNKYDDPSEDYTRVLRLQPLNKIHLYSHLRHEPEVNSDAKSVHFLTIIAVFILFIAWMNYINLATARSVIRAKEVGIRKVLGSLRLQLVRQFIGESILMNTLAFGSAVVLVCAAQSFFNQLTGKPLSLAWLGSTWIWLFLAIGAGVVLSGLYPAFMLSSFSPVRVLRGKLHLTSQGSRLRKILVVLQFAVSIALIIATLTVINQISFMQNRELGMDIERTLIVRTPNIEQNTSDLRNVFKKEILSYPTIQAITISSSIPSGEYSNAASGIRPMQSNPEDGKRCFFMDVGANFFDFYGIEMAAGRSFSETDRWNESIIMNEEAVKIFGLRQPELAVNQKMVLGGLGGQVVETVGVIKNYHHKSLKARIDPVIYNPLGYVRFFSIKMGPGNLHPTLSKIENTWKRVFKNQPFDYFFLDDAFNHQYQADQRFGKVFGLFSIFAIMVSCLGLFGLASFTAAQRTKEIGVRKVLGASVSGIAVLLSREFTKWVLLANLLAIPAAWYSMNRWLENFAYRIQISWGVFLLAGVLTLIIAILTVSIQTVRAANSNPVDVLKYE